MTSAGQPQAEIVFVVEEAGEGGFVARSLDQSIFTEAATLEQLREAVREAVACHFEECMRPRVMRLLFGRDEIPLGQ
jgi:hypothetical protein